MSVASAAERLAAAGCVRAEEEAAILVAGSRTTADLAAMVARREAGAPLEHIVGWAEFRGLRLVVDDGVFVPRARSGLLVEETASLVRCLARAGREVVVVDLCCGVGAIGAALAAESAAAVRLHAVDVDPRAVDCAERNLAAWGGRVHRGDLFDPLPRELRGRTDLVVSSPPYVPSDKIRLLPAEARDFESRIALDGGPDGLALVERIARRAREWLAPGGRLALEVSDLQVDGVAWMLEDLGYRSRAVTAEDDGSAVAVGSLAR
jgi:release factor glutamine methyltransferase